MGRDYKTRQQELILAYLSAGGTEEITAGRILAHLKDRGTPIGLATIYRHLDKLVRAGKVCKYYPGDGSSACYRFAEESDHGNLRLRCMECGQSVNLPCGFLEELQHHLAEAHQFTILPEDTVLNGRCGQCDRQGRPK